ncbi:prepilin-type N-terminal cleavage/methylation domain-containing protein [Sulfurimonas sp.]|uniref:prepilin-type N-terminal cleavage/methylation domain-containing protein n=1 Tax=Sulfurimonas sp. TaxID=2022749 RepID=UPI0025F76EA0|nr:prepilin-type N-terminal cleavage/methylation domain-containing protein [Sulfurimonas sp.]MDD5158404.1 prepilin-type N-terminal cleavage/methylation domain-containing protein [Sulfurimonas sp.]
MKKAFTMLELIFVIIVIGIIAAVVIPRTGSNKLNEAALQVLSHIRYTQHLAMVDDRFNAGNPLWFRENWQIEFKSAANVYYQIYSDRDHNGNCDVINREAAVDSMTGSTLDGNSNITDLKKTFSISSVAFSPSCSGNGTGKELSFDVIGRPYFYITSANPPTSNIYTYLLLSNCDITLTSPEGTAKIRVHPETGYACILNNAGTDCL